MKKIFVASILLIAQAPQVFASTSTSTFPQPDKIKLGDTITFDKGPQGVLDFIDTMANWFFAILITISVIYILLAAFEYMSSKGGEGVEKAHKMLAYAAVGIAVAVLAKGIVFTVRKLVDRDSKPVSSINLIIPNYYA